MGNSKNSIMFKIVGYAVFLAFMAVFISAWAMGTAMNVKSKRDSSSYQLIFIFGVFMYVSYLFWGKYAMVIPLLLAPYLIYNRFLETRAKYNLF